jgi:signal transduction histidine kinase
VLDPKSVAAAPPSVSELIERVRGAGLPVTLEQQVPDESLPLAVRLVVFRLVQEALTNVRRHAGRVPTTVRMSRRRDMLEVEVMNKPGRRRGAAIGGPGLTGMRERTELYGGRLHAGPDGDGRWRVRAELPLSET